MRLRTGLCGLLLAILPACETIPVIKIEIDDRVIELKRKPPPVPVSEPEPEPSLPGLVTDAPRDQPGR